MHALAWASIHANVRVGVRLIQRFTFVGAASCSSDILCCHDCTLHSIPSVYPDSENFTDILLIVPSS
jgi:hypothetical protein